MAGAGGSFDLVEDSGTTSLRRSQDAGEYEIGAGRTVRTWTTTFPALTGVDPVVTVNDLPVPAEIHRGETRTSITVRDVPVAATLRIGVGARPRLRRNDVPASIFALLDRAQIPFLVKTQVLETIRSAQPLTVLHSADLDDHLLTAIGGILLAQEK